MENGKFCLCLEAEKLKSLEGVEWFVKNVFTIKRGRISSTSYISTYPNQQQIKFLYQIQSNTRRLICGSK